MMAKGYVETRSNIQYWQSFQLLYAGHGKCSSLTYAIYRRHQKGPDLEWPLTFALAGSSPTVCKFEVLPEPSVIASRNTRRDPEGSQSDKRTRRPHTCAHVWGLCENLWTNVLIKDEAGNKGPVCTRGILLGGRDK